MKRKPRTKFRPMKIPPPVAAEVRYYRAIAAQIQRALLVGLEPALAYAERLRPQYEVNNEALGSIGNFLRMSSTFETGLRKSFERIARLNFDAQNKRHRNLFASEAKKSFGVKVSDVLLDGNIKEEVFARIKENVDLCVRLTKDEYDRIHTIFTDGFANGENFVDIRGRIKKEVVSEMTSYRAKVIARDQTSKFNGALNQIRQQNLGVSEYIWRASNDERTRETHAAADGLKYSWDQPPDDTDGHPGEAIQCRCYAEPVLGGILKELTGIEE